MPDRIANIIVLAEDKEQQNLVLRYLQRCGHDTRRLRLLATSGGSGEKYVRDQYAKEVRGCRSALGKRASALLIVVVDADTRTTASRATQLSDALEAAEEEALSATEPVVVLIPKRNVETWIRALLGSHVDEVTDYKKPVLTSVEIKNSASELYKHTRHGAKIPTGFPPSLAHSISEWRRIPS